MASPAPVSLHRRRPAREDLLEARRRRAWRFRLYAFSVVWAAGVGLTVSAVPALRDGASPLVAGLLLLPAVGAGLLAGTRSLPWYYATAAVIAVCVAVVVSGSLIHCVQCLVTGKPLFRPAERLADDPVSAGSCRVSGGVSGAEDASIATASPTGDELPKRRFY